MILGIIMTVLGIFGVVVFLYMAYKVAKTPVENEKDKVIRLLDKGRKISTNIDFNKNYTYLDDIPDETSYLFDENEIISDDTDILLVKDDESIYTDIVMEDDETELLGEETEYLDDETTLL